MTMTLLTSDLIVSVAEEVFTALVDGEEGMLYEWIGEPVPLIDPLVAWVDLAGDWVGRAVLLTERSTADDLSRALLRMGADEELTHDDLIDAFGEVANVVGGNIKSVVATHGNLSLPQVATVEPAAPGAALLAEVFLAWRGRLIVVRTLHLS